MFFIFRDCHAIILQRLSEYRKIETESVMRYDRLIFDKRLYEMPHLVKGGRIACNLGRNPMDINKTFPVKVLWWLNQDAEFFRDDAFFDTHKTNLADAVTFSVCRLKVNSCKCVHGYGLNPNGLVRLIC